MLLSASSHLLLSRESLPHDAAGEAPTVFHPEVQLSPLTHKHTLTITSFVFFLLHFVGFGKKPCILMEEPTIFISILEHRTINRPVKTNPVCLLF